MTIPVILWLAGGSISIHNPGVRLELFLKELSAQAGSTFQCPSALKNEVMAADFDGQSVAMVTTQLARVLHAEWNQKDGAWWLSQSGTQQSEERRWNLEQHRAAYESRLKQLAAYAPKFEWTPTDAERLVNEYGRMKNKNSEVKLNDLAKEKLWMSRPENRLVARVSANLKADDFPLEGLNRDNPRISPTPLPAHFKVPINVSQALKSFRNEYQLFEAASGKQEDRWKGAVNMEIRTSGYEAPEFNLYLYDENWRYVTSCWASLQVSQSVFMAKAESFPLSKSTQAMMDFSDQLDEDRYDRAKDKEYKRNPLYKQACEIYFHAKETDPLGILQGACWIDFARSKQKPLLVSLEEDVFMRRPKTFVPTIEQLPSATGMSRIDEDGWVLGRPKNPLYNRTWRLDRSVIEKFSRLVASPEMSTLESQIRLDDIGRYANTYGMGVPYQHFLIGYDYRGNGPFCLLGTLSEAGLRSCLQGNEVMTNQLPERAQTYLKSLLQNGNLDSLSPLIKPGEQSTPAYCYPDGLPTFRLGAKGTVAELFSFSTDEANHGYPITVFCYQLKRQLAKDPALSGQTITVWHPASLTAELRLGDRVLRQEATELGRKDAKTYTWESLPQDIKMRLLDTIKNPPNN